MSKKKWQQLFKDLTIAESGLPRLTKPTESMLAQYERESGFFLPKSYRNFLKVFGPGVLAWSYRILAPGYSEQGDIVDLVLFNESAKSQFTKKFLKTVANPDQLAPNGVPQLFYEHWQATAYTNPWPLFQGGSPWLLAPLNNGSTKLRFRSTR